MTAVVQFEFATTSRLIFGSGQLDALGGEAAAFGRRALLVTGRTPERAATARAGLASAGITTMDFAVRGEPTIDDVRRACEQAREGQVEMVVACGGGSAIDTGKAVAALLANGGDPLDYLEVIGHGRRIERPSLPFIAVPTTAGTGAEVTRNAVLGSPEHRLKVSLRSPLMLPRLAIVDPDLLNTLPAGVVASSGLDALVQLVEPFVSVRANPLVDALCREGIARSIRSLRPAFEGDRSERVRVDLALASLFGGLALANAGLGAAHGLPAAIGGMFTAPHGATCAALLPAVVRVNANALRRRAPEDRALDRYHEIAALVTGRRDAAIETLVSWLQGLVRALAVPGLARWGVGVSNIPAVVSKARAASSTRGNPIELEEQEFEEIVRESLELQA